MKGRKKLISSLLMLCLTVGVIPMYGVVNAADEDKMIMAGASGIAGAQADSIYYGTYLQSSDGTALGYKDEPIEWRVLSKEQDKLFVLADQNLDSRPYHSSQTAVTWATSSLRTWLNGEFLGEAFNVIEQGTIADTTVTTADNGYVEAVVKADTLHIHGGDVAGGAVDGGDDTTDKVFLLSIEEANNDSYFQNNDSRIATNTAYTASKRDASPTGKADIWRLRSPGSLASRTATVKMNGKVDVHGKSVDLAIYPIRPAMNLDLNKVLFTSAAKGGKAVAEGALVTLDNYTGTEWKATILDETRTFTANVTSQTDDAVTVSYENAVTGANEYLSAIVVANDGSCTHYGRIKNLTEETDDTGTETISVQDIDLTGKTLYVFNEQYNGGEEDNTKLTDYASALISIEPITNITWSDFENAKDQAFVKGAFDDNCYTTTLKETMKGFGDATIDRFNATTFEARVTFASSGDYIYYGGTSENGLQIKVTEEGKLSVPALELLVEPSVIEADSFVGQEFTLGITTQYVGDDTKLSFSINGTFYQECIATGTQLSANSITINAANNAVLLRSVSDKKEVIHNLASGAYTIDTTYFGTVTKVTKNGVDTAFDSGLSISGDYTLLDSSDAELGIVVAYAEDDTYPDSATDIRDLVGMKRVQRGAALSTWSGTMGAYAASFNETTIVNALLE